MERVDLSTVIQQAISKFSQNRIGDKPPVFVSLSPALTEVLWRDRTLKQFLKFFLYEALLTSDPDSSIEISLRHRGMLADLKAFVGIDPSCWLQLRVSGRGLRIAEPLIEDLFEEVGYRCEEWLEVNGSCVRLGIFGATDGNRSKLVFCIELRRNRLLCDLLIPIKDAGPAPGLLQGARESQAARV